MINLVNFLKIEFFMPLFNRFKLDKVELSGTVNRTNSVMVTDEPNLETLDTSMSSADFLELIDSVNSDITFHVACNILRYLQHERCFDYSIEKITRAYQYFISLGFKSAEAEQLIIFLKKSTDKFIECFNCASHVYTVEDLHRMIFRFGVDKIKYGMAAIITLVVCMRFKPTPNEYIKIQFLNLMARDSGTKQLDVFRIARLIWLEVNVVNLVQLLELSWSPDLIRFELLNGLCKLNEAQQQNLIHARITGSMLIQLSACENAQSKLNFLINLDATQVCWLTILDLKDVKLMSILIQSEGEQALLNLFMNARTLLNLGFQSTDLIKIIQKKGNAQTLIYLAQTQFLLQTLQFSHKELLALANCVDSSQKIKTLVNILSRWPSHNLDINQRCCIIRFINKTSFNEQVAILAMSPASQRKLLGSYIENPKIWPKINLKLTQSASNAYQSFTLPLDTQAQANQNIGFFNPAPSVLLKRTRREEKGAKIPFKTRKYH
ncbi:MAG: hypothetical protein CMF38_01185 [Legionellaceae bacterium]|nr:hypothetical protein [Legionellaceae bacterium]HCA89484.1 hypothetical protein [Legionellales bacterium]|tara:strand:+ start:1693 stop:3171 length:1479 start_codon:yes stop_codon:yes gene_type:complete